MGVFELFLIIIITVLLGWGTIWIIGNLAPGHPPVIDKIIWIVVVIVVIVVLLNALGLAGFNPQVPRLR